MRLFEWTRRLSGAEAHHYPLVVIVLSPLPSPSPHHHRTALPSLDHWIAATHHRHTSTFSQVRLRVDTNSYCRHSGSRAHVSSTEWSGPSAQHFSRPPHTLLTSLPLICPSPSPPPWLSLITGRQWPVV